MSRKRMIYAELFEDEHFGKLSDKAKLLFIACIANADDDGRLNAHEANLRAYAFRYEEISLAKIKSLLSELTNTMSNFKYYTVNSCNYIEFSKWNEYQHIREDRYKQSTLPKWQPSDNQMSTNGMLNINEVKVSKDNIKEKKRLYMDFVLLTNKEHEQLVEKFGLDSCNKRIAALDDYIGSKGAKYASHYRTILVWAKKDGEVAKVVDLPQFRKCKQCGSGAIMADGLCVKCFDKKFEKEQGEE
jgi:hypothetical protein